MTGSPRPTIRTARCTGSLGSWAWSATSRRTTTWSRLLVGDLEEFTGAEAEQEDDITLVVVTRHRRRRGRAAGVRLGSTTVLAQFTLPSEEGNERIAIDRVAPPSTASGLEPARLERLKTAVGETVMNAIEHGNEDRPGVDGRRRGHVPLTTRSR